MAKAANGTYDVLVVDDCPDDRFFLRLAIERFPRFRILHELPDGQHAIDYLSGVSPYDDRRIYPLPDVILLDLKMPRKTGHEVLDWLKSQSFSFITVIVLSGSVLQRDVETSLASGAHGHWQKTASAEQQRLIVSEIEALLDRRSALQ